MIKGVSKATAIHALIDDGFKRIEVRFYDLYRGGGEYGGGIDARSPLRMEENLTTASVHRAVPQHGLHRTHLVIEPTRTL